MEDIEFKSQRLMMVDQQLIPRGIKDPRVLDAMRTVPRHHFVPDDIYSMAYEDSALSIGEGQTISQPYMVAIMTELLSLTGEERVLEIGTGSGYQTAILAELSSQVVTIERIDALSLQAKQRLNSLGYDNIILVAGDGTLGAPDYAPYDRILITAGAPELPIPLIQQLNDGGIIVAPVGSRYSQQLIKASKIDGKLTEDYFTPCVFVPLVGEYGW